MKGSSPEKFDISDNAGCVTLVAVLWTRHANRKQSVHFLGERMHANSAKGKQSLGHPQRKGPETPQSKYVWA